MIKRFIGCELGGWAAGWKMMLLLTQVILKQALWDCEGKLRVSSISCRWSLKCCVREKSRGSYIHDNRAWILSRTKTET